MSLLSPRTSNFRSASIFLHFQCFFISYFLLIETRFLMSLIISCIYHTTNQPTNHLTPSLFSRLFKVRHVWHANIRFHTFQLWRRPDHFPSKSGKISNLHFLHITRKLVFTKISANRVHHKLTLSVRKNESGMCIGLFRRGFKD